MGYLNHDKRILPPGTFFFLADLAAVLFALWVMSLATGYLGGVRQLLWLAWTLLLIVLFFRRGQDEFWDHCWRRAGTATFLALLILPFCWLFAEGFIERLSGQPPFGDGGTLRGLLASLFGVFFVTFEWTRFREGSE